jgi:AcrR family transcriptional regulator
VSRKQSEATTETKQNLIDAYWELYTSDIPRKITVQMITDRAGYNRGTFYAYFLDIEDLHDEIENALLPSDENFEKLREASFSKNIREIIEIFMQIDRISGEKISFLLGSRGSLSFQNKLKSKLKELFLKYAPLDLKESDNVIDYKADIACSIFYETICYWHDRGNRLFSGEEMSIMMLKIIYSGLTNDQTLSNV